MVSSIGLLSFVVKDGKRMYFSLAMIFFSFNILAEDNEAKPLWEIGIITAGFVTPEYPASDKQHFNPIVVPYFVYRGEILRIENGSAKAVVVENESFELDISFNGSFNASSNEASLRQNMPDLDYLFEVGPQLIIPLASFEFENNSKGKLFFNGKLRGAFATDLSSIDHKGYVFQPELAYEHSNLLDNRLVYRIKIAPTWVTEELNDYFYQVDSEYVTENRPLYNAEKGYVGTSIMTNLDYQITEAVKLFSFVKFDFHSGAKNSESPLFAAKQTHAFGIGISWRLKTE